MFLDKPGLQLAAFLPAGFSSKFQSNHPASVPAGWAATRCQRRAGYVFAGLGRWVLEETVKPRMRHRDEHTRHFRRCREGCLALADGDTMETRQFCMWRCLGSALRSSGTGLGKDGHLHGRGGRSLACSRKSSPQSVSDCVLGSAGGWMAHRTSGVLKSRGFLPVNPVFPAAQPA